MIPFWTIRLDWPLPLAIDYVRGVESPAILVGEQSWSGEGGGVAQQELWRRRYGWLGPGSCPSGATVAVQRRQRVLPTSRSPQGGGGVVLTYENPKLSFVP